MMRIAADHLFAAVAQPLLDCRDRHIMLNQETAPMMTESVHPRHRNAELLQDRVQHPPQDIVEAHWTAIAALEHIAKPPITNMRFQHCNEVFIDRKPPIGVAALRRLLLALRDASPYMDQLLA